ncbi:MAG: methyltransferase domain-containing protein [Thermoanaerobaculum sp.]|nr:methyltransferase domain-containing protein [Thermoanaerobaculum sp.]MDW7967082.1 methyltransferase domain-containing protein [Thermoanaerobaculum sp.]
MFRSPRDDARRAFFEAKAWQWETNCDGQQYQQLQEGLRRWKVRPGEVVLDLGCGTGVLARLLAAAVGNEGRVVAVDYALPMLWRGRREATGILWVGARAQALPLPPSSVDRAILLAVWPHLRQKSRVLRELVRVLKPNGWLHLWHLASRRQVNRVHRQAGKPIALDQLEPASQLASRLQAHGFSVVEVEEGQSYRISAVKEGDGGRHG